jgi:hypothetical protein
MLAPALALARNVIIRTEHGQRRNQLLAQAQVLQFQCSLQNGRRVLRGHLWGDGGRNIEGQAFGWSGCRLLLLLLVLVLSSRGRKGRRGDGLIQCRNKRAHAAENLIKMNI